MGKQLCAILILSSMVISISAVHGITEDPISVEKTCEVGRTPLPFRWLEPTPPIPHPLSSGESTWSVDNPLTVGPELSSKQLGRAQGIYGASSMEEMSLLTLVNLAFTDGKYNGSTLAPLGRNPILEEYREMSIVGGSGLFRLARGIATAKTYSINATSGYGVVHYHVIAIHY
ncbi:hypothetical protein HYC85_030447 [Camellia sinensis]|uniref:Dirigent protein n=1 Tax=Camellia sinensis TaxID=4442 RepID=A0A7J7G4T5_CAMSI|nr:hypothetical protein HYC85_030447 [Camellia sinensis]